MICVLYSRGAVFLLPADWVGTAGLGWLNQADVGFGRDAIKNTSQEHPRAVGMAQDCTEPVKRTEDAAARSPKGWLRLQNFREPSISFL